MFYGSTGKRVLDHFVDFLVNLFCCFVLLYGQVIDLILVDSDRCNKSNNNKTLSIVL